MEPNTPRMTHRDLLPRDICPSLMMKHILTGDIDAPLYDDRGYVGDGYFWCMVTCEPIGPDDELCDPESCRAGRACHEGLQL